ncbi:hypothetical protein RI103_06240 [Paraburkholderia sp. FT54]|uniref:hypothetical protein n=1 Tax=Paraburkholderia sp. FT54 TaxID=3074437 RepID=UPI0028775BE6|nr:hypothetical protein [Paraburkholderia sp. FT54]WNC90947.1 hypothetical protein RI103_06240 [Paraburkholderia sp. FT54]
MPKGVSIREFARLEGVSDTLVRKALKLNRLKAFDDKSIDPALVGTAWREGNAKGANPSANSSHPVRSSQKVRTAPAIDADGDGSLADAAGRLLDSGAVAMVDYATALQNKENYLALLRQLEYEQKSGSLVALDTASAILFEEHRAQRDAWLNWPTRVGPILAAELGLEADRVTEALTAHVHNQIAQLGEPEANFSEREG